MDNQDTGQEGTGYGQSHQPCCAHTERCDNHYHHQQDRAKHVILQVR